MSSASLSPREANLVDFPPVAESRSGFWLVGLLAAAAWFAAAMVIGGLPDIDDFERTDLLARASPAVWPGCCFLVAVGGGVLRFAIPAKLRGTGPWLLLLAVALTAWELVTAKFAILPRPFFASPQALLEVFTDDYARLGDSVWNSVRLLAGGYVIGAAVGFTLGVADRLVACWSATGRIRCCA